MDLHVKQSFGRRSRRGFTLSEMLVVLGLLVTVTALAQPVMSGALGDSRLRSAAKLVRVELAKARLRAMQTGVAQQFRHEIGKGRFETAPATLEDQRAGAGTSLGRDRERIQHRSQDRDRAIPIDSDQAPRPGEEVLELSLPEGVSFDDREPEAPATVVATEDGWSEPIVFYPDGQTHSAHLRLKGERNSYVEVSLRGLTGVATAGRLRHEEELR